MPVELFSRQQAPDAAFARFSGRPGPFLIGLGYLLLATTSCVWLLHQHILSQSVPRGNVNLAVDNAIFLFDTFGRMAIGEGARFYNGHPQTYPQECGDPATNEWKLGHPKGRQAGGDGIAKEHPDGMREFGGEGAIR